MMFRRKPGKPVEANQFWEVSMNKEPLCSHPGIGYEPATGKHYVVTIHGQRAYLRDTDWILPEPQQGGFYPVADQVFQDTYELVAPATA